MSPEYNCVQCKDWTTLEDDSPCPGEAHHRFFVVWVATNQGVTQVMSERQAVAWIDEAERVTGLPRESWSLWSL